MLDFGGFSAGTCNGVSRRAFLKTGASFAAALGISAAADLATAAAVVRAKSVVFVWLWGAPSHLDTFDPKPDAPSEYRGPFAPIATRTPGLHFTELLPQLAERSHLFNVIRSHITFAPGHPDAGTYGLTGFAERPEPVQPNFGSIIAKHRGHRGSLPPFVSLGRGIPRDVVRIVDGYGGGKLGKSCDPFQISCDEYGQAEIPSLKLLGDLNPARVHDRNTLLATLDQARRELDRSQLGEWDRTYGRAYQLLTRPEARDAFDLTRESPSLRDRYGATAFGQSCLMARRLVEAGVPYIQVNWSEYVECMTPNCDFGWDTHIYNFELLQDRHCPIFDRALSALLDDLHTRGLLDSTLVVAMGEFGRTPKITNRAARDHWHPCYSSLWAGAGLAGGRVIGLSDKLGEHPVTSPVTPLMVGTTMAELAGLDTQARAELSVLDGGTVIHELVS
jgi:uncharacterized protein (DUF1501 family)